MRPPLDPELERILAEHEEAVRRLTRRTLRRLEAARKAAEQKARRAE